MRIRFFKHFIFPFILAFYTLALFANQNIINEGYMKNHSLVWEDIPFQWNEGAFLGNGIVGMMIYVDKSINSLIIDIDRPDVTDHRGAPNKKSSFDVRGASVMHDYCRLDIGRMKLTPNAHIIGGKWQLDIYNGILSGTLITDKGTICFSAFTPYDSELNIFEIKSKIKCNWSFLPGNPLSPRFQVKPYKRDGVNYIDNPNPRVAITSVQ